MKRWALLPRGGRLTGREKRSDPLGGGPLAPWHFVRDAPEDPASLARRIQAGDSSAEPVLVEHFGRGIRRILRHAARDPTLVDDLYQETFRVALERIRAGALRSPEHLGGFLAGLARHLAIEHFRRVRRNPSEEPSLLERLAATGETTLDHLAQRELAEHVRQTLEELPTDRDREVLHRFYLTAEDKDLICADLEMTRLQFNRVLYRARERFRERWLAGSKTEIL
jgi:RNA polymerase sigma-70 factor (ECF subfamily)